MKRKITGVITGGHGFSHSNINVLEIKFGGQGNMITNWFKKGVEVEVIMNFDEPKQEFTTNCTCYLHSTCEHN